MTDITDISESRFPTAASSGAFSTLALSSRMPVLFIGHGSPMNAIEDNAYRRSWQELGQRFGREFPVPQLILCVSAHWLTRGWHMTAMEHPKTIHDFGGFPQALFDEQYPVPGSSAITAEIAGRFSDPPLALDATSWGLDHGAWSILKPMFPAATIPVVQLSMDYDRPPAEHFAIGRHLAQLRDHGVLIVGSGNIVHNLRAARPNAHPNEAFDWAVEFDRTVAERVQAGDLAALCDFQTFGSSARLAHPTYEHFLPLLYTAGAVDSGDRVQFFNVDYQLASISMRSMIWAA